MDKQELLEALALKFVKVLAPELQRTESGIKWYLVGVYDKVSDTMIRQNISFYVAGEGTADEAAYWGNGEPKPTPPTPVPTFASQVGDYITAKIIAGVIKEGTVERANGVAKTAVIQVVVSDAGVLKEWRFLANIGADGKLQHTKIEVNL